MRYIDTDKRMFRGANIVGLYIQSYLNALNSSKKNTLLATAIFFSFSYLVWDYWKCITCLSCHRIQDMIIE
jgi:hypothetical protein